MCQHHKWLCLACNHRNVRAFRCVRAQQSNTVCTSTIPPSDLPPNVPPQLCDVCGTLSHALPGMPDPPHIKPKPGLDTQHRMHTGARFNVLPLRPPKTSVPVHASAMLSAPTPAVSTIYHNSRRDMPFVLPQTQTRYLKFWQEPALRLPDNVSILQQYRHERARTLATIGFRQSDTAREQLSSTESDISPQEDAWVKLRRDLMNM
jgi:hypothetical protein